MTTAQPPPPSPEEGGVVTGYTVTGWWKAFGGFKINYFEIFGLERF